MPYVQNKETIEDFFAKLGSLYGHLNLLSKPMLVYNANKMGISIVHTPATVVAEVGRQHKRETHSFVMCVHLWTCLATNAYLSQEKVCA